MKQNPRWRSVFIALVLALAIGSAGQSPPAQAAPAGVPVNVYMELVNPKTRVCVGKTAQYAVRVYTPPTTSGSFDFDRYALPGIKVEGFSQDKTVGDFLGATRGTLTTRNTAGSDPDIDEAGGFEPTPNTAYFTFKAKKAGTTTLYFEASAHGQYVSDQVSVKVIPCKFKVKTLLNFYPGIYDITVISDNAVMTADEQGTFTGSTSMYWVYSNFNLAPCTIEIGATDSQVALTGQLDEDGGQFMATQTFQPQSDSGIVSCPGGSGGGTFGFTVNPLTFSVASLGGVVTQTVTAGNISGTARIVVVPEEEGAVSFIPGDHEATWDDFSSLFGALLALH